MTRALPDSFSHLSIKGSPLLNLWNLTRASWSIGDSQLSKNFFRFPILKVPKCVSTWWHKQKRSHGHCRVWPVPKDAALLRPWGLAIRPPACPATGTLHIRRDGSLVIIHNPRKFSSAEKTFLLILFLLCDISDRYSDSFENNFINTHIPWIQPEKSDSTDTFCS